MMLAISKKKKIIKYLMIAVIFFTVCGFGVSYFGKFEPDDILYLASNKEKLEFSTLSINYEQSLWGTPNKDAADKIAVDLVSSSDGFYFKDLNYADNARTSWQPTYHLERLLSMIKYYGEELISTNETIRGILIDLLNYWLSNDFKCLNWYYNEIRIPKLLLDIGIMLKSYLSEYQIYLIGKIAGRGSLSSLNDTKRWTGANMLDAVDTTIRYSFFMNKPHLLKKAVAYAEKEIFISEGDTEGIKMDYSFYQHGAQQAIASYGLVYVSNIAKIAYFLNGTSFQISDEKLGLLVDYIIYGQRYAYRGNQSNYLTNGRAYSRRDGSNGNSLKTAIGLLILLENVPKKEKLQEFYYAFDNLSYSPDNTTYFPYSHTLFDISPGYYMAVKGAYNGYINSELVNSENLLARNMAYGGLTTFQYTGYEYNNIGALWDFSMLPGTTAFNETDEMLADYPSRMNSGKYRSTTTHSGGAANGELGGLYVDIENEEGLYSRQSYISYKGLMICLGNSISCSDSNNKRPIFTTINQVYEENASFNGDDINSPNSINDSSAVFNGAFAYYNLGGGNLTATVDQKTGNLTRNNLAQSATYTGKIFKLYYTFGLKPENQTFAYAVLTNSLGTAPANAAGLPILRITNTKEIQSVEFTNGDAVIIFHKAGTFTTNNDVKISAESDCVRLISV